MSARSWSRMDECKCTEVTYTFLTLLQMNKFIWITSKEPPWISPHFRWIYSNSIRYSINYHTVCLNSLKIHFYFTFNARWDILQTRWPDDHPDLNFDHSRNFQKFPFSYSCVGNLILTMTGKTKVHDSLENYCYCTKCLKHWPFQHYYFCNWDFKLSLDQWTQFRQMMPNEKCRSPAEYNIRPEKSHQQSLNGI